MILDLFIIPLVFYYCKALPLTANFHLLSPTEVILLSEFSIASFGCQQFSHGEHEDC